MSKSIKHILVAQCKKELALKQKFLKDSLISAQESTHSETKSSAGDKHETGRAMAQLEQENLSKQLDALQQLQTQLNQINPDKRVVEVQSGAVVKTEKMNLFFGVPFGKMECEGKIYYCVSMLSPIGQAAKGKSTGEQFSINGVAHTIISIL